MNSSITSIKNFNISQEMLFKLTKVYYYMGKTYEFTYKMGNKSTAIIQEARKTDAKALMKILVDMPLAFDSKQRSLKEEELIKLLSSIVKQAYNERLSFNTADLLEVVKTIYKDASFSNETFVLQDNSKKSVRFKANSILDELDSVIAKKEIDPLLGSLVAVMELFAIDIYTKGNYFAWLILFYYLLLKAGLFVFSCESFFEAYLQHNAKIKANLKFGMINYDKGMLFYTDFFITIIDLILASYEKLEKDIDNLSVYHHAFKADYIEKCIIEEVPSIFTKSDISTKYPEVSQSTIERALQNLKDRGFIMPLGTGRSAKWKRLIEKDDPEYLLRMNGVFDEENS